MRTTCCKRFMGRFLSTLCLLAPICGGVAWGQKSPAAASAPSLVWKTPLRGKPEDYVGSQTCAGCHRVEAQEFFKTPHAQMGEAPPVTTPQPGKTESPSVAAGRKLYNDMMCSGCHQIGGQGGTAAPALDDVGGTRTREQLMDRMLKRRAGTIMPTLPPDTPTEKINQLVDYLMTLKGEVPAPARSTANSTVVTGCEACHGPGKAHAEAEQEAAGDSAKQLAGTRLIFKFDANPKVNSERCLVCHVTGKSQDSFGHSMHLAAGVSCQDCHSTHLVDAAEHPQKVELVSAQSEFFQVPQLPEETRWLHNSLLKESEPGLCFKCHATVEAEFALPEHHRVPEGLMKCTDCHNPHGNMNRFQLTKTSWETCVNCHVEKRGPFAFEHAAARVLGCVACHTPHGSVNNFLLVRREQRLLCLQCHTGFHNQGGVPHSRGGYQASGDCTRCHVAVHGSNFDEYLLR
jgi:predicted CXXCH cytochrome family protein